MINSCISI